MACHLLEAAARAVARYGENDARLNVRGRNYSEQRTAS